MQVFTIESLVSLLTLTVMEVVLGIDNVLFVSIIVGKLPRNVQPRARISGLSIALLFRIGLLFAISSLAHLMQPIVTIADFKITAHTLIMGAGGAFLMYKSITEIHEKVAGHTKGQNVKVKINLAAAITQIILIDIVFSFDSILTAIGVAKEIWIMIAAVIISMFIMLAGSARLNRIFQRYPTIKMLALAFLLVIGFLLMLDAAEVNVPKSYLYVAMGFAFGVEILNINMRKRNSAH